MKQSRAKLTTVSIETCVRPIDWWQIWWPRVNFGLLFWGENFSTTDISHTFCQSAMKFGSVRGLANRHLLRLWWTLAYSLFRGKNFWQQISGRLFVIAWRNPATLGSGQSKFIPEFCELWSGGPRIQCSNMCQSFTDRLVKWFFDKFPVCWKF